VQREGDVVHIVAHELIDMSGDLASFGSRDTGFPLPHGRGDELHHGSLAHDAQPLKLLNSYGRIGGIKVRGRDFR
jgi:error-prone DNA polymerase